MSALAGAAAAGLAPQFYLRETHAAPAASSVAQTVVLRQLANLYVRALPLRRFSALRAVQLYFALVEALVLRSTNDRRVWRTLLLCLLIADVGHLWSCAPLALFTDVGAWNAMAWGNIGFVYAGATMRLSYLLGNAA